MKIPIATLAAVRTHSGRIAGGAGLDVQRPSLAKMLALGCVLVAVGVPRFRRRFR
ncbi:MAG: hypothetical protein AB1768_02580 [Pseudomonadota bacterium]|jgi:hypothetical protein